MHPVIQQILENHKITEYLESKGHHPVKRGNNGRLSYLCPFKDHKETKPSFVVFTNAEYENFMCFGCSRYFSIINLVSELEGISLKEAIKSLGVGLNLTIDETVEAEAKGFERSFFRQNVYENNLAFLVHSISFMCYSYLKGVSNNAEEMSIIDGLYSQIDSDLLNYDFDSIEETSLNLERILFARMTKFKASS